MIKRYYITETVDGETHGEYFTGSLAATIEAIRTDWRSAHITTQIREVATGKVVYSK
jgi:hypothetical protein